MWALATGTFVLWLAHERYDFVYWVMGFLLLTWGSTLAFGRATARDDDARSARFRYALTSYLIRVMYQETLFFLIPFYAYSTVLPSWNLAFVALLGVLAVLACLDLVFDRWLRESAVFGLLFFASVAFAALNLLIPMLLGMDPATTTPMAAVVAVLTAWPLAARSGDASAGARLRTIGTALGVLAIAVAFPQLVPPVPLRLQEVTFAEGIDREDLELDAPVTGAHDAASFDGAIFVLARVFAPANVPARVSLAWYRDDVLLRHSREVDIVAHEGGFRLWDAWRPEDENLEPGRYRVVLRTAGDRAFGSAEIEVR